MKKHPILFLAANPAGLRTLRLDEQARQIQEELRRASRRDRFEFVSRLAARPIDLLRALREVRPSIVHFAGHAQAGGIFLTGEHGQLMQVTREALQDTFGAAGRSVQIIVLNACATEELAKSLCDFVPVCVGTSASVSDDAARAFSVGFYGALASGESAAQAWLHGKAAMQLETTGDHDRPRLHHRRDVDPELLVLADDDAGASPPAELAAVIERYRARKGGSFERWDLRSAGPTPTTGNRPAEITLDEMYIPLRFDPSFDPICFDRGAPIRPDDLFELRKPRVVIGAAGSGKTTWMRWTFRRLIRDPRAIPFFLELRAIAAAWRSPQDAARPVESYLADALSECGASDPSATIRALLDDTSGPRPMILLDGWDELGGQGERLRERLVELCRASPHVAVVVSSRPYGETRPAGAEAFETVYIQPLSDSDIRQLAIYFHRRVHGHDELEQSRATDEFMAALTAAPDARSLAGTALLLTMLLLLSREGPLPDRRHKLYTACLRNMLLHRVSQRERDGVAIDLDRQWRPDDGEERLRVVAELAYRMQTEGYERSRRAPMVRAWDDAVGLLAGNWTAEQRARFLHWLVASAGILIDRTDGSVQFAHLSFQEYLAAYYLFISREAEERLAAVRSHMGDVDWWETLRLWAALISDQWPDKLGPVLDVLRTDAYAYWLAGQIFADGNGRSSDFDIWVDELPAHLSDPFTSGENCASAWGTSRQEHRRSRIAAALASAREHLHWLAGTWHANWCELARLEVDPAPALLALEAPISSAAGAARSRVLHGAAASWPDRHELAILRLWPSTRVAVGVRLQTATSLGIEMPDIVTMLPSLLAWARQSWSARDQARVEDFGRSFARGFARGVGREISSELRSGFIRDFARYFDRDLTPDLCRYFGDDFEGYFGQYFGHHFDRTFGRYFERDFVWDFARHVVQHLVEDLGLDFGWDFRTLDQNLGQDFGRYVGLVEPTLAAPWLPILAVLEISSAAGRAAPRAALAHGPVPDGVPLLELFRTACRASFAPHDASLCDKAARACNDFDGDPLWPALARHLARLSTTEDRTLLVDLARHPEAREPPLSWGLQYYIRGDLVLDDDSIVTFDELCAHAGLEPPPLLEELPDELDI